MSLVTHPPRQKRSRDSLEKLMTAGLQVLETEGWDGFTIGAVAARAGVGRALVHRRFKDKDALLIALHAQFGEQLRTEFLPRYRSVARSDRGLEDLVNALMSELSATFRSREGLMRFFVTRARVDERLAASADREIGVVALEFEHALLAHRAEFRCANPELAVAICFQLAFESFVARLEGGSRAHPEIDWDTLTRELSVVTLAYLRSPPGAANR
jgi:AcrR family transcriptional regulator